MSAYLDHAATTPMSPQAIEIMTKSLEQDLGNPTALHSKGRAARAALDNSRELIADTLEILPAEVIFTSGGTEADNLALNAAQGGKILVSPIEHSAVLKPAMAKGAELLKVDRDGILDLDYLKSKLDKDVALVSVMLVNNEIGTIEPMEQIVKIIRKKSPQAIIHTDAIQAFGWTDVKKIISQVDLVSISAHKIQGPKGIGALIAKKNIQLHPLLLGGGQESGKRSGTPNVAGAVAMGLAVDQVISNADQVQQRVTALTDKLTQGLLQNIDGVWQTISTKQKAANNCHLLFDGLESEALLMVLDEMGIYASAGSSCASGALEPSHVLMAIGLSEQQAKGAIRFSLGASSTEQEIDFALENIPLAVQQLRQVVEIDGYFTPAKPIQRINGPQGGLR